MATASALAAQHGGNLMMEVRVSELGYLFSSLLTILHGANKLPSQISNFLTCKIIASFTLFLNFLFTLYKL